MSYCQWFWPSINPAPLLSHTILCPRALSKIKLIFFIYFSCFWFWFVKQCNTKKETWAVAKLAGNGGAEALWTLAWNDKANDGVIMFPCS